jgi:GMC oxidoreductase
LVCNEIGLLFWELIIFFLVGAGTAGCILAARLSEDPERTVLLMESGPEFGWLASVPLAAPILQNTVSDWAFRSVPQQASQLGLKNKVCLQLILYFSTRICSFISSFLFRSLKIICL